MNRRAMAALIMLAACSGRAAAMPPTEMESGLSSQTAPYRGEAEAAPKAVGPAGESSPASARVPMRAAPKSPSETQGLAQSQTPASPPPPALPNASPSAPAGDERASAEDQRYSFYRVKDKFLRLDSLTGQVTQCGWNATGWSCNALPDERAALEAEIARLQGENAALKKALLAHGLDLPTGTKPEALMGNEPPAAKPPDAVAAPRVPSQTDLDRAIAFMKDVWRRLVELVADLQRDIQRRS